MSEKTRAHYPAFPSKFTTGEYGTFGEPTIVEKTCYGLTKREYFAIQILNRLLSNSGGPVQGNLQSATGYANCDEDGAANWAVEQADALIKALNHE